MQCDNKLELGGSFGFLTVIAIKGRSICVRCHCGNELWVKASVLQKYGRKSCGCMHCRNRRIDLVGLKRGRLIVVAEMEGRYKNYSDSLWKCKCDCGNEVILPTRSITRKKSNNLSCGCYKRELDVEKIQKFGCNNPSWKGGITPLADKIKALPEYAAWRNSIFQRDDYTCFICRDKKCNVLQAHHIKLFSSILVENQIDSVEKAISCDVLWDTNNGITVCIECHKKVHNTNIYTHVWKPWGLECWLVHKEDVEKFGYCYKKIIIRAGHRTSLQYHEHKIETNYLLHGVAKLWLEQPDGKMACTLMQPNDIVAISPPLKHRIEAIEDCVFLEASSSEVDDVIRVQDDSNRPDGCIDAEYTGTWKKKNE